MYDQFTQQGGIYHTIILWARLSPRLTKRTETNTDLSEPKPEPESQPDEIDKSSLPEEI